MANKKYSPEQAVAKLRQIEVLQAGEACLGPVCADFQIRSGGVLSELVGEGINRPVAQGRAPADRDRCA